MILLFNPPLIRITHFEETKSQSIEICLVLVYLDWLRDADGAKWWRWGLEQWRISPTSSSPTDPQNHPDSKPQYFVSFSDKFGLIGLRNGEGGGEIVAAVEFTGMLLGKL